MNKNYKKSQFSNHILSKDFMFCVQSNSSSTYKMKKINHQQQAIILSHFSSISCLTATSIKKL